MGQSVPYACPLSWPPAFLWLLQRAGGHILMQHRLLPSSSARDWLTDELPAQIGKQRFQSTQLLQPVKNFGKVAGSPSHLSQRVLSKNWPQVSAIASFLS